MNYWHMQLHPNNLDWGREEELLRTKGIIGMGHWKELISQQSDFEYKMAIGDVVAIKRGGDLIALVQIDGGYVYEDTPGELDWCERRRAVKILDWYHPAYKYYVSPRGTLTRCNMQGDARSNESIWDWYEKIKTKLAMNTAKDALLYKGQIILQGPPGTGKTRLALEIAETLTTSEIELTPVEYVEQYIKGYKLDNDKLAWRVERAEKRSEFLTDFPAESLAEMDLSSYCAGNENFHGFCYWMERGLSILGKFAPNLQGAPVYRVFWRAEKQQYETNKVEGSPEEVMKKVASAISNLVLHRDLAQAKEIFIDGFILKVLHSYYPEDYFPVFNHQHLQKIAALLGIVTKGLDHISINREINNWFQRIKTSHESPIDGVELMREFYEKFGLKKSQTATQLSKLATRVGDFKIVQFHPAYSYEDFVRGIAATTSESGNVIYQVQNRILADFAARALANPSQNYVLILDEINRANLPAVLGELIYALEYRYDETRPDRTTVEGIYAYADEEIEEPTRTLRLPKNLYIIGTMNTADRSVGHIDYAIRRRFAFVDVLPSPEPINTDAGKKLFKSVSALFIRNYDVISDWQNPIVERAAHLAPDFRPEDVWIGHSYFITKEIDPVKAAQELRLKRDYEILPILNEYLRDGVLLPNAEPIINAIGKQDI